jgi:hypothetical protein
MSADGHVVASEYGCGAHSDTPQPATIGSPMFDPFDDGVLDVAQAVAEPEVVEPEAEAVEPEVAEPEVVASEPEAVEPPAEG